MTEPKFNTVPEAIEDIKAGKCVIVADDEDRENEGDLIMAADKVTPEMVNFFAKHGRFKFIKRLCTITSRNGC